MKTIDMTGQACPTPVIQAKKAMADSGISSLHMIVDNAAAAQNLENMASGLGYTCTISGDSGTYNVVISKSGQIEYQSSIATSSQVQKGFVVTIGSDKMGSGVDELGKILIKGFIYSLTELEALPQHVIFLNSGVNLTATGANTIDDLTTLVNNGTQVLSCGTCLNYYKLENNLAVGQVTNMYQISEILSRAQKIVNI